MCAHSAVLSSVTLLEQCCFGLPDVELHGHLPMLGRQWPACCQDASCSLAWPTEGMLNMHAPFDPVAYLAAPSAKALRFCIGLCYSAEGVSE